MITKFYQIEAEDSLDNKPFEEGALYYCIDTGRTYMDPIGSTTRVATNGDPIVLQTEANRESLLSPIPNRLYAVLGSSSLYIYQNSAWYALGSSYTHPSYTARTGVPTADASPGFGGTFTVSQPISDTSGHVTAINSRTITIPNAVATTSANGLMSKEDKAKVDGIEELIDNATNPILTQLDKKANDFSIEIYNGTGGNPKPVRFASFNYSTCNSEAGISAKISLVSGHGNGTSYAFLEDAIIRVNHTGTVEVDNFKYYGTSTGAYDGADRQYGDIFWLVDTTNKIVDFYVLMGQYARVYQTPWKRLTYSSGGTVTQHTSCTVYSSGTKVWANNSDIALLSDLADHETRLSALEASIVTVYSGTEAPLDSVGEDGDLYLYTGE